ncbi:TolB family protein [Alteromonas oceanisediminis]|uniref:TolB family protein n=1 Tax=Alteromonas oceanisediminis TaxID=2836180 RepID=UPI001BDA8347|nr:PD40 domain-containing protein [Alteromonas oceanisediminis]MBT0586130.1 PD40 domain-containing protein [Alteromonas oceanisediminis]
MKKILISLQHKSVLWLSSSLLLMALFLGISNAFAEDEKTKANFPHTDIFLFDLISTKEDVSLRNPRNITQRKGYDNQPKFTPNSDTLVFSRGDEYQTDVYEYVLSSGEINQLTDSPETEFSPTPSPDNQSIAFVSDRNGSVFLGRRNDLNNPVWALADTDNREPIGYFAWDHSNDNFFYWSRYGYSVTLVNQRTGMYHFVAGNTPPSTPHLIPNSDNFSFVHRQLNEQVWIKALDPATKAVRPLVQITGPNMNYAWAPDGTIFMIQNNVLMRIAPSAQNDWQRVADLTTFNIKDAARLAVSPDGEKLAVVGTSLSR